MLKKSPIFILILFLACSTTGFADESVPLDYAVVLRDTPIYESLELYAAVIDNAAARQFYPLKSLRTDEYGILWAEVWLDEEGSTGFLTDIISLRLDSQALGEVLDQVEPEAFALWDQETVAEIMKEPVTVGVSLVNVLLAEGMPLATRNLGTSSEYAYPEKRYLIEDNRVAAILNQNSVPTNREIHLQLLTDDPGFSLEGGRWEGEGIRVNTLPDGTARFSFRVPVTGDYRFLMLARGHESYSAEVTASLRSKGEEVTAFQMNQKLSAREIRLGMKGLEADTPYVLVITAADGAPFSVGPLTITYLNKPGYQQ